jgi:hypothetical protein
VEGRVSPFFCCFLFFCCFFDDWAFTLK